MRRALAVGDYRYDVAVLDVELSEIDSLELLQRLKAQRPDLPVLLLNGSSRVEDRVRALNAGADDYLSKPFVFAELAARIRAVVRRASRGAHTILTVADLALDRMSHSVQRSGRSVPLSPREFALLE